jgi:CubicO group peptidase (beta-lactamase class C family)
VRHAAVAACLTIAAALPARAQDAARAWPAFVQSFDAFVRSDSVVGAGVVLVQDGRAVQHHETGWGDRELGQRADERSIYHWASNTKTLTAVAIMQLRDRGLLTLDDPVTRWVPEIRQVHNPFGPADAITIRMLLAHTSGFQNPTWPYGNGAPWEPFEPTRWEQLVAMMPYQRIHFRPGERWSYSNPAFIYLARIIEAITGDPYQGYIHKNIWTPLGMTRSYFGATPWHLADQRSNNYTLVRDSSGRERPRANGRDFDPGITIPNGGWNAPIADVVTWVRFLTGAAGNDGVLRRATVEEMWQPVVPLPAGNRHGDAFGLSFFIRGSGDARVVGHTGDQAGFRTLMFMNPRTGDAIIAAFNTINDVRERESGAAFATLLRQAQDLISR